jgi:DNA (cytosine-5)-methyltransferase 1
MPKTTKRVSRTGRLKVAELFAGVGGFRLGFDKAGSFDTVFSSQWEPPGTPTKQFASRCYVARFGPEGHWNEDIEKVLERVEEGMQELPDIDVLCGGFPCQDYSVAKPANQSKGIRGKKGVLWWQIHRMLKLYAEEDRPVRWVVLENVDRLLKSPTTHRGRDFAVMLATLSDLGYDVEWRVINAADYGFPQRRRRVFIVAYPAATASPNGHDKVFKTGVLARSFPLVSPDETLTHFPLDDEPEVLSAHFGKGAARSRFFNAGFVAGRRGNSLHRCVWTYPAEPKKVEEATLGSILIADEDVPAQFYISKAAEKKWKELKGAKRIERIHKGSGAKYVFSEGALPWPDPLDRPARTILTGEGGSSASRFKHVVETEKGLRRLTPEELERLNGFAPGHTDFGMTPGQRAFCMGNALVVGVVTAIAKTIAKDSRAAAKAGPAKRRKAAKKG